MNNGFPAGVGFLPTGRFGAHFDTRFVPFQTAVTNPTVGNSFCRRNRPAADSAICSTQPFSNAFFYCTNLGSAEPAL